MNKLTWITVICVGIGVITIPLGMFLEPEEPRILGLIGITAAITGIVTGIVEISRRSRLRP